MYIIQHHVLMSPFPPRCCIFYTTSCSYATISPSVQYFIHRHVLMPSSLPRCCILYTVMYLCHHFPLVAVYFPTVMYLVTLLCTARGHPEIGNRIRHPVPVCDDARHESPEEPPHNDGRGCIHRATSQRGIHL